MAQRWSFKEDFIIAKYCFENPWAYSSDWDVDEMVKLLKVAGYENRTNSAVKNRARDYETLHHNWEYPNISKQERKVYTLVDSISNEERFFKNIPLYMSKKGQEEDLLDERLSLSFDGAEQLIAVELPKPAPAFQYVLEEMIDRFYMRKMGDEKDSKKRKKIKNKAKSDLYEFYINENTFNAIRRGKYPTVKRENIFRICFGLELSYEEAKRLMASAGLEFELSEDLDRAVVGILTYDGKARFNPEEIEATIDHFAKTSLLTIKD